jgi:acyl dehydratase
MRVFSDFNDLKSAVGREVGVSNWLEISQERINKFADATGDEQWIHVDPERAAHEMPGGKTIAHGLLSLSLIPMFMRDSKTCGTR